MSLTSNGLFSPMNRFGFHKRVLLQYSPHYADPAKVDCYIPTRAEVFRMRADSLFPLLQRWFTEAPEILAPSPEQKEAVLKLLRSRYDASAITGEIEELEKL